MEKSKRFTAVFMLIVLTGWLYYESLPSFHIHRSFVKISDSGIETTLDVIVYKIMDAEKLCQEIAEEHNRINSRPNKLEMNLYFLGYRYRTVIFNYKDQLGKIRALKLKAPIRGLLEAVSRLFEEYFRIGILHI